MTEIRNQDVWNSLCSRFTADQQIIDRAWNEIDLAYRAPARAYHTLVHISVLLNQIEEHTSVIENKAMLLFTTFYHDVVYTPGSGTNEKDSAAIAEKRMKELHVPEEIIRDTKTLILLTKSHAEVNPSVTNDMLLFLDMDLSIIGARPEVYGQYCEHVREEFKVFPDFIFRKGRRSFLKSQLKLPLIFHTESFRNKYEVQARLNIITELREKL